MQEPIGHWTATLECFVEVNGEVKFREGDLLRNAGYRPVFSAAGTLGVESRHLEKRLSVEAGPSVERASTVSRWSNRLADCVENADQ